MLPGADSTTIRLPHRATVEESYQLLACCQTIESDKQAESLDGSQCERFGPLGVALLALALERRQSSGLPPLAWVPPKSDSARSFLDQIGFSAFAACGGTKEIASEPGTLKLRQLTALNPVYTHDVAGLLAERVPGTTEDTQHLIELCLNELLQNVFEHAKSRLGCIVQSRWYAEQENVRLAVVDGGIGIPAALRRKEVASLHKKGDADVIVAAVTHRGITSRTSGRAGGVGLKLLHELATERGGGLTVLSSTAKAVFKQGRFYLHKSPLFRGTAIEIDFRPSARVAAPKDEVF